jgi:hypothetical protein
MRRKSKLAQQRARTNVIIGSIFILAVAAVIGAVVWWSAQKPDPLDPQTLCPLKGPLGHQVLLVDRTDPFNEAQKAAFDNMARDLVEKLPTAHLFSVFVLGEDFKSETKPLIELCNPGTGEDKSNLTENTKALRRQYTKNFIEPLQGITTELLSTASAQQSPILEMLQLVYLNSIQAHKAQGPITLYVLSDLLQYSNAVDMYHGTPDFAKYDATYQAKKLYVDLSGVDVKVVLLNNNIRNQNPSFMEFWQSYFKRANVHSLEISNLPG